ncbi:MAG TPA: efflux RND transporter periplasmic adaptor subunit [Myxococcales bacterium]|jgi:RND family efflux transporter MFP subunit|nr:efflux RND transporter periplasmic adaptor subunit [Myxococcales bacterium]
MPDAMEKKSRLVAASSIVAVIAAAAGTVALFARERTAQARQSEALQKELAEGPMVQAVRVPLASAERVVSLPAEVRAEQRATLYAKVSGYVKEVLVDKGERVRKGQVLAVLESPDQDQQVASAHAELTFRKQQLQRTLRLSPSGRVSVQDREAAEEAVKVARAALTRAEVQKGYEILRAPFDGTVTARYADPGALLPAATGGTASAQPLVDLAQLDKLRVALQLGQDDAARVRPGDLVRIASSPDQAPFEARISRIAQALDARSRTMLCEIDLPNPPAGLYPGAFVQTTLSLHGQPRPLLPTDALIGQGGQLFVALVEEGKVHFQRVRLGVDDGSNVEVLDGLRGGELVALSLGPEVKDGAAVRVKEEPHREGR